jgi:hypothetical protein
MPWVDDGRYPGEVDRLETLPLALDPGHMRPVLSTYAPFTIDDLDLDIYRRHGNRCVIRYRARGAEKAGEVPGEVAEWRVIGKVLPAGAGEALDAGMRALWAHGFARGAADGIGIPEPLAYLPALSMHLQEDVGGTSIRNLVKRGAEALQFRIAARALAKLHGCGISAGPVRGVEALLLRCHPRHPFLGLAFPELAAVVDDVVDRARALEQRWPSMPVTPVHGDFHLGQVHVDGDRAWLVDLDALGFGDPASDVGNLLVFLDDKVRREPAIRPMVEAFRDEYARRSGSTVWERVPLYEALTLLRRASKQLRLQQPGWGDKVRAMVQQAERKIAEAEALSPARPNGVHA